MLGFPFLLHVPGAPGSPVTSSARSLALEQGVHKQMEDAFLNSDFAEMRSIHFN